MEQRLRWSGPGRKGLGFNRREVMYVRYSYPVLHWVITMLTAPLLLVVLMTVGSEGKGIAQNVPLYPLAVMFGAVLSIPTLLLYLVLFRWLRELPVSELFLKALFDILLIACVGVTLAWLGGSMVPSLLLCYSLAIVMCSIPIRFRLPG